MLPSNYYSILKPIGTILARAKLQAVIRYIIDPTDATAMISGNFYIANNVLYIEPAGRGERHD